MTAAASGPLSYFRPPPHPCGKQSAGIGLQIRKPGLRKGRPSAQLIPGSQQPRTKGELSGTLPPSSLTPSREGEGVTVRRKAGVLVESLLCAGHCLGPVPESQSWTYLVGRLLCGRPSESQESSSSHAARLAAAAHSRTRGRPAGARSRGPRAKTFLQSSLLCPDELARVSGL